MDFIYFLGRFHVLLLHLPITLVFVSAILDWLSRKPAYKSYEPTVQILWAATALSAVATVTLGYMHFSEGGFTGRSALAHRALGTSVAVGAVLVWILRGRKPGIYKTWQPALSLLLITLVTLTGHFGGNLTHGDTYLVQYAPQPVQRLFGLQLTRPPVKSLTAADPYLDIVRPIFEQRCFSCHNDAKQRGELNLSNYAAVMKGGKDGVVVTAGKPNASDLYRRINLPRSDKAAMPAEGKTPLTAAQKAVIGWWIEAGARTNVPVGNAAIPSDVLAAINLQLGLTKAGVGAPGAPPAEEEGEARAPVKVNAQIFERLAGAAFMARQASQSDQHLIVSTLSPGMAFTNDQLQVLVSSGALVSELDLERADVGDPVAPSLAKLPDLVRLRLDNDKLTDKGISALSELKKLEYLNLYGNTGVTDASVDVIAKWPAIRTLYVWGTRISPAGVAKLRQQKPNLYINDGSEPEPVTVAASGEPGGAGKPGPSAK